MNQINYVILDNTYSEVIRKTKKCPTYRVPITCREAVEISSEQQASKTAKKR